LDILWGVSASQGLYRCLGEELRAARRDYFAADPNSAASAEVEARFADLLARKDLMIAATYLSTSGCGDSTTEHYGRLLGFTEFDGGIRNSAKGK
jgi:hypothetical protein